MYKVAFQCFNTKCWLFFLKNIPFHAAPHLKSPCGRLVLRNYLSKENSYPPRQTLFFHLGAICIVVTWYF